MESVDFTCLLEQIEKIDDLETLEDIEQMLVQENQNIEQIIDRISLQNVQLKDELNAEKCLIKELDQLHSKELEEVENLREDIRIKKEQVLQEQNQQVEDLTQFELEVHNITAKFVTAPKLYENCQLNEKIDDKMKTMDNKNSELMQQMEKVAETKSDFEDFFEVESMDMALSVMDNSISEANSYIETLSKSFETTSKEIDKIRFD